MKDKREELARQLHEWYLEATLHLTPDSFNKNAQKSYDELTEQQKNIDRLIANRIIAREQRLQDRIDEAVRVLESVQRCKLPNGWSFSAYKAIDKALAVLKGEPDAKS